MGLLVFDKNEVLQAVLSNDGSACPYYGAIHDEKINLENTLTFLIPADHTDAQFVIEGSLVAFKDLDSEWQLFEVKRMIDTDDTVTTKQVYCEAAFYELLGDIVPTGGGNGSSAWIAVISALSQSRWEDGTMVDLGLQTTTFDHQTALGCLQQIAATWKGELQFRVTIANNVITHRYVDLLARRGSAAGKQFVFGKDLQKVEREVDFNNVYTAMYGRGQATIESARLTFADSIWTLPTNPANKPEGQEWIGDTAALAKYGLATGSRHRFGIFDDSQEADPLILLQKTWDALQNAKEPVVNYQFTAILLEQLSPEYSHEAVRIGDTTAVIDNNFSPPLQLMVRVIEIQRNILEFDKTKITLGNFRQDLATTQIGQNQINGQVKDNAGIWDNAAALTPSVLDPAIYDLTSELRSAGGYVVFSANDGMMVYDTPDPATATKAMKLGGGVFGIANSKNPDGSWNFRTFGDGAGFTADLITSGKIKADFLQIGPGSTFDPGYDPSAANINADAASTAAGNALAAATAAQTQATVATTTANSKRRVFVAQPTVPYDVGDLWVSTNGTGDLKTCVLARATGAYVATEWMKAVKYTDDATANSKRRVFTTQPIPPYDIGDLWVTATDGTGDLKTSTRIRTVDAYQATDWVLATKYTDDATANTAIANAATAQGTANTAITNASAANALLTEMTDDNKLTAQEKQITKTEWDSVVSEVPLNDTQANLFEITTQKTTYDNAYAALNTYISPLLSVLTTTSNIDGPTFRTTFKTFYDARTNLLNAISGKAKTLADSAATQATLAIAHAATAQTQANKGVADALAANNLIADIASDSKMVPSEKQAFKGEWDAIVAEVAANDTQAAAFGITTEKTTYDNAFSMLNTYMSPLLADLNTTTAMDGYTFRVNINTYYIARAKLLNAISLKAKTTADTAQALATSANAVIADMASDDKLTPTEKQALLQDWNLIVVEEPTLEGQADTYGLVAEKSGLYTSFTALGTYLNNSVALPAGNVPCLFTDLTTTSTIVGSTLRQKFVDYYWFKEMLGKAVTDAGKVLSDTAQGTADAAQADADTAQATADTAVTNAYNAKTQADLGVANAATANGLLADMANDGKLTAQEKQNAKMEWDVIVAEKPTIDDQATNYAIGVDKTNYGTAYANLNTYVTPLLTSLTTTTNITGATFRATFKDYYDKKTFLLKAIADKAKTLADNAQTQANLGVTNAATAQAAAATAQTQANKGVADTLIANNLIADIASDSKLTPSEKQAFKREWDSIIAEVPVNDAQATTFVITTEKTTYDNAYSALNTYMTPLLADLNTTTAIDGYTFRVNINTYYIARAKLLLAVSVKAKSLADTAQIRADLGITNAATAQTQADLGVTNAATAQTTATTAKGTADAALANAATAQTQANLGVTNAATANNSLAQIASDASFSPVEKKNTQKEWAAIITEVGLNDTQAALFGITTEKTTYDNAYTALSSYITPLLADLTSVSAITGLTFRNTFYAYYIARTNLLNLIAKTTKTVADTAITNAGTAQEKADTALTTATSAIARTHWSDVSKNKTATATGGTIAANGPTYYAGNWTCTVVGQSISIDLGSLMPQIVEIGIDSWFPSDTTKIPKNFTIEWSTNNSTWTNAATVANNAIAPYVLSTMASTFSARYIRLTVSAFQASQTTSTLGRFWISSLQGDELTFAQDLVGAIQTATNTLQISTTMYADATGLWLVGAGGQNVVKITSGGIAIGTAGVGGAFTTAMTGTGIVATAITSGTIDAAKMAVINLDANSITTGTMLADRIDGGTLSGVIVTASSVLGVSSNMWNAGTSNGLIIGTVVGGYGGPATLKLNQGLTGDGSTYLNLVVTNGGLDITAPFGVDMHNDLWVSATLTVLQQSWFTGKIYANGGLQIPTPVWTTPSLGGGWVQYPGQEIFAYYKDPFGFVHFKGSLKSGLNSTDIFILPSGSRPAGAVHFAVVGDNGGDVFASIYIGPTGNVRSGSGSNVIRTFDGITFLGQ